MKKNITILILFLLVISTMTSVSIYLRSKYNSKLKSEQSQLTQEVKGTENLSYLPVVKNIAPTNAIVGQEYRYDLAIMDSDTYFANLKVSINQGPTWLRVDGLSVVGIPPFYAEETNKVVLKISDGKNFTLYTYYILVNKPDESN